MIANFVFVFIVVLLFLVLSQIYKKQQYHARLIPVFLNMFDI